MEAPKAAPAAQAEAKRSAPPVERPVLSHETQTPKQELQRQQPRTPTPRIEPIANVRSAAPPVAPPSAAPPQLLTPAVSPPPPPKAHLAGESAAGNRIHIGAIDVHITPPPPKRPQKPTPVRTPPPSSALSRGFFSPFGLRQG
jgi:hypothetical protein